MLEILTYPHDILRNRAEPVKEVTDDIRQFIDDMAETMYAAPGVGLAANQVGVAKRIVVIDVEYPDDKPNLMVFVNPVIVEKNGAVTWEEGCLSFPEIHEDVDRAETVKVRALGRDGKPFELDADGLLSIAIQHELDHLEGVLLIDHVSFLKKRIINRQMQKAKRTG